MGTAATAAAQEDEEYTPPQTTEAEPQQSSSWNDIGQGALQGAAAGSPFGLTGIAFGAGIGAISSYINGGAAPPASQNPETPARVGLEPGKPVPPEVQRQIDAGLVNVDGSEIPLAQAIEQMGPDDAAMARQMIAAGVTPIVSNYGLIGGGDMSDPNRAYSMEDLQRQFPSQNPMAGQTAADANHTASAGEIIGEDDPRFIGPRRPPTDTPRNDCETNWRPPCAPRQDTPPGTPTAPDLSTPAGVQSFANNLLDQYRNPPPDRRPPPATGGQTTGTPGVSSIQRPNTPGIAGDSGTIARGNGDDEIGSERPCTTESDCLAYANGYSQAQQGAQVANNGRTDPSVMSVYGLTQSRFGSALRELGQGDVSGALGTLFNVNRGIQRELHNTVVAGETILDGSKSGTYDGGGEGDRPEVEAQLCRGGDFCFNNGVERSRT
ncbi:MAG: hypothetical protein HYZ75_14145 [Elusimicrobia bacterium]|nr:hypothetical protein [Elusimicrobiota bacterium]